MMQERQAKQENSLSRVNNNPSTASASPTPSLPAQPLLSELNFSNFAVVSQTSSPSEDRRVAKVLGSFGAAVTVLTGLLSFANIAGPQLVGLGTTVGGCLLGIGAYYFLSSQAKK